MCSRSQSCRQQPPHDCPRFAPPRGRHSPPSLPRQQLQQPPATLPWLLPGAEPRTRPVTPPHRPARPLRPPKFSPCRPPTPKPHEPRRRRRRVLADLADIHSRWFRFISITVVGRARFQIPELRVVCKQRCADSIRYRSVLRRNSEIHGLKIGHAVTERLRMEYFRIWRQKKTLSPTFSF